MFPAGSAQGDISCIKFNLFTDILLELDEDFVVELNTNDPAVVISEDADLTIITIIDVPDPNGTIECDQKNLISFTFLIVAVVVSLIATNYNVTEAMDAYVEVCLQIILGTVLRDVFVGVQTEDISAKGESHSRRCC